VVVTEFVSAVPIIPAQEVEASVGWYRDRLGFDVFHTEREYGIVGRGRPGFICGDRAGSRLRTR
jgi:hypothetical protein